MPQLNTSAMGDKLPRVETGLQQRACIAVAIALSTRLFASASDFGGFRLIIVRMS